MTTKTTHLVLIALLFFIVSNPMTYRLTDAVLGGVVGHTTHGSGCPTTLGLVLHTVVFAAAAKFLH